MLQISSWSKILTALILAAGILIALPNVPGVNMPSWLPHEGVNLGLDLQGGSYLLLQVDFNQVDKDRETAAIAEIRAAFRKARIAYTDLSVKGDGVQVRVTDPSRMDEALKLIDGINPTLQSSVLAVGARQFEVAQPGGGLIQLTMGQAYKTQSYQQILQQSIEVVRKRVDALGTKEPDIAQQGEDQIIVQVPGLQDPTQLKQILGKTAKMTFQLVDETADPNAVTVPVDDEVLPVHNDNTAAAVQKVVVQRRVLVTGEHLTNATAGFNQQTGQPEVVIRFDSVGARQFGDVTKENVNHRFAIVLDKEILTDPVIEEPILGGTASISGSFTSQTASNLAILLRAGAFPATVKIIEERTVGAELGSDSVKAGRNSAVGGLLLVALFMIGRYGLFGLFADIALTVNVVLLLAVLSLFGATLTLPGIAGIVLTMGMAVDANVLIYERIREEQRNGRTMLAAIDTGFKRAMATIIDANMTHLIASLILFELGSGPVQGFAVTLGVGIITSFFTAVMVTRLIVVTWLNTVRPRKLAI